MKALAAAAAAIALSIWVGWTRYALLEPAPIAVLTASAPVTVHGARFTLVGVTTLPAAEDAVDEVPGSATVRLDLTQTGGSADLTCSAWLVAGQDSWRNRYSPKSSCSNDAGQEHPLSFFWVVPAGTQPSEFRLRFGAERVVITPAGR